MRADRRTARQSRPRAVPWAVHRPWRSNDVGRRSRTVRRGRGEKVSGRRATVWNGGQRAEEKKVEERNRAFGGRPRFCCESRPSPPNAERAPRSSWGPGERVPFIEPFSPPPLDPPSPVARLFTPLAPRALFTRVLDVRSSLLCKRGAPEQRRLAHRRRDHDVEPRR